MDADVVAETYQNLLSSNPQTVEEMLVFEHPLKRGSRGDKVELLQELLGKAGFEPDTDGYFGRNTKKAVQEFQEKSGLKVDGIVDIETWNALVTAKPVEEDEEDNEDKKEEETEEQAMTLKRFTKSIIVAQALKSLAQ